MKSTLPPQFWAFLPFFFVAMWVFVCLIISLTGWRALAGHFRAVSKPQGRSFSLQSAEIGGAQYRGCLSLVVAESGLWMRPYFPFRAFHPPVLVPWSAFGTPQVKKILWGKEWSVEVQTPDRNRTKIILASSVGELIEARIAAAKATAENSPWSEGESIR